MNRSEPDSASIKVIRNAWQERKAADSSWAHELMTQALDEFSQTGFPTTRLENWKYTDVRNIATNYPQWLGTSPNVNAAPGQRALDIPGAIHINFVDGIYRPELANSAKLPEGVYAGNISELAANEPALKNRFGQLARNSDSGFVALNTAFSGGGIAVILPENFELQEPIYLHFHVSTAKLSSQPRILVDLGPNSRATLVEHYTSDHETIVNSVTEIRCAPGAELNYYKIQDEHVDAWHTAAQYVELERDARLHSAHLDIGAALARNEMLLRLAGQGAHAECNGLFMADQNRHVDSRLNVEHAAPNTTSREQYRGILAGKARGVFNGRIYVEPEAQKTSAELTNRNLLLNRGTEIDTKPELEIYADDVKCAHGSTTGQLDATALFYLLSRGIAEAEARNMLVAAFADELMRDIGIEAIAQRAQQALSSLRISAE